MVIPLFSVEGCSLEINFYLVPQRLLKETFILWELKARGGFPVLPSLPTFAPRHPKTSNLPVCLSSHLERQSYGPPTQRRPNPRVGMSAIRCLSKWLFRGSPWGLSQRYISLSSQVQGTGMTLGLRYGGVAVSVVDLDMALTPEVGIKDIAVAVVPPPGAQLPVPCAVKYVEELRMLHTNHGKEVLVPEVAAEAVLVS